MLVGDSYCTSCSDYVEENELPRLYDHTLTKNRVKQVYVYPYVCLSL